MQDTRAVVVDDLIYSVERKYDGYSNKNRMVFETFIKAGEGGSKSIYFAKYFDLKASLTLFMQYRREKHKSVEIFYNCHYIRSELLKIFCLVQTSHVLSKSRVFTLNRSLILNYQYNFLNSFFLFYIC